MGLNLRKLKDAAFAQINPFDGGKTANTVWNNTPVGYKDQSQTIRPTGISNNNGTIYINQQARQASQARPQQSFIPGNQKKSGGFMGALSDVFDANTANDVAKRNQEENMKAMNAHLLGQPVYTPKLNQTYTQQQTTLGNRSYTNPIQSVAYGLAKDPAKGLNTLAGAYAKGLEGAAGLTAIAGSKLANTSDEYQNNLQQEVGNRMNAPIAFSNKGGLLGQGTNFKTAQELDNKKKFASSMAKTGVDVGSVIPVGGGAAQGTGIIAKQGAKQVIGNSLLNAGLSGTQSIATQVNENRPINLKEAGLSTLAGGAVPVAAFGAGRLLKGVSNKVATAKPTSMNQSGSIDPAQAFKNIRDKLNGSALDTTVKPATPENVYGVNALEKLGKKLGLNQGGGIPNPAYDPLDALKAEAKKYKSAKETIKQKYQKLAATDPNGAVDGYSKEIASIEAQRAGSIDETYTKIYGTNKANLASRATKYKNPDDFVKDIATTYHGTPFSPTTRGGIKEFDINKSGLSTRAKDAELGIFVTPDENFAGRFTYQVEQDWLTGAKKVTDGGTITPTAILSNNILDLGKLDKSVATSLVESGLVGNKSIEDVVKLSKTIDGQKELQEFIAGAYGDTGISMGERRSILKELGYDVVKNKVMHDGKGNVEMIVIDPNAIMTKQQLTDLYNQATKPKPNIINRALGLKDSSQGGFAKLPGKAPKTEGVPKLTEEQYLSQNGAHFMGGAEPALHRQPNKAVNAQKRDVKRTLSAMDENNAKRAELRKEYQAKLEKGEIAEPTRNEILIEKANGLPELESTQAAQRLLTKQGIDWKTPVKTEGVAPQIGKTVDDTAKVTFGELHDSGYLTDDVAGKLGKQYGLNAEQVKAIGKEHSVLSPTRQKMIKADEAQKAAQSTEKPKVTMQEGRANRVLDKKIRYNGKVMTRGEYIDALISDGYAPTQKTVNGKTTYSMKSPKGDYYDISKIESAKAQSTPPKAVAPKGAPIEKTPTVKIAESAPKPVVKAAPPTEPNVVKPVDVDAQLEKEIFGVMSEPNYKQSAIGKLGETLSPNRQIRKVTQAIEGGINKGLRGSLESGSRIVRTPGRTVAGVSRQAGRTNEELAQYGKLQGGKQMGDELGLKIAQNGDEAIKQGVNPTKIADALDPALTSARGGKAPVLTELEQSEVNRLRRIIDLTHEGEHNLGLLNDKVYKANKGTYFPRNFDEFFENDVTRQIAKDNKLDLNIFKNRKDLADIPKEVLEKANRDPYYMTALRTQQYAKNKAVVEHTRWLKDSGSVIDAPKKGYIQVPDSPAYGAIKGKYVLKEQLEDLQGFIYETDSAQHVVALLNTFDRNPARQFLKKTKTVYNPGVRLGNRTFNYLTAGINGINPITYTKNWARANGMMKNKSPEFIEATKEGVFGSSIIDKELYQVGDALTPTKGNVVTKAVRGTDNAITNTYKGVDDKAKMATYLTFRERGVAPAEAAKRTRRAMQNYDMVGQFFDLGAKAPIGGSAFVRFSSELIRMAHNSAVDNPLRLAGAMASVVALTTMASKMLGESPEDRKTREGRLGAPKVPFTNQSLEVQTPYGAINIGRLLGVTTYNDINGGVAEDGKRLLPFQLPITNTKNGVKFNPNFVTSDPLIGPIMGQIIDKDFRGKSIKDPENTGQFLDKLSTKDQVINRAKVAGMSYIPLANEANSLLSAVQGKENFYGKKRSPAQAGLRVAGIKVEQYGPEQAKKQRSIDEYFKEKDALDKEVATLPKKDQEAYKQATGYYKLREQVPNEFSPGETRYKKAPVYDFSENKWGEYASSPKLYDLIMKDKERKAQKGQPLQPEFDKTLSDEFRKQLISNKALAPGEDVEADQRMYQSSEWDTYSKLKDKYTADAKKYYPDKGDDTFVDEMVKHQNAPFPKKGSAKQAYDDAYALYTKGQGAKPTYTDQVDADKEAYSAAKLKWTNTERKARGLGPISKETWDNVTFGFESDEEKVYKELKYGRGYGGYSKGGYSRRGGGSGGGGSGDGLASEYDNPYKYAVSIKAKGSSKATVKLGGKIAKRGVTAKATSKPKVTIKKSTA